VPTTTKTIVRVLEYRKPEWFKETESLYNKVCAFYFDAIQAHEKVLDLGNQKALTALERITHKTTHNPDPVMPLPWSEIPAMFRRSCINAAIGVARSFYSHLEKHNASKVKAELKGKKLHGRPPVPPREWDKHATFYGGMCECRNGYIMLKLYTGSAWVWVKFKAKGREIPEGWKIGCPHAVLKKNRIELHFPIEKELPKVAKLADQVQNPGLKVCTVDLNLGDRQAVCSILTGDGTETARFFINGGNYLNGRRKHLLGRIAVKRSKTGVPQEDVQDNKALWERIRDIEENEAHQASRQIVNFARKHGASVIVFEHLGNLKPEKGKYSRRSNSKRAYWLKGRIFNFTKYKAWEHGIITSRVNPKNTSRLCSVCHSEVFRHVEKETPTEYRMGAPLFTCPNGHRGNADMNAARNIGQKFFARYKKKAA
jgi:IS605 OrfB family transposase